jgi:hypothetical protein
VTAQDLDFAGDTGSGSIDLDSENDCRNWKWNSNSRFW